MYLLLSQAVEATDSGAPHGPSSTLLVFLIVLSLIAGLSLLVLLAISRHLGRIERELGGVGAKVDKVETGLSESKKDRADLRATLERLQDSIVAANDRSDVVLADPPQNARPPRSRKRKS